jgi:hypothetical protein
MVRVCRGLGCEPPRVRIAPYFLRKMGLPRAGCVVVKTEAGLVNGFANVLGDAIFNGPVLRGRLLRRLGSRTHFPSVEAAIATTFAGCSCTYRFESPAWRSRAGSWTCVSESLASRQRSAGDVEVRERPACRKSQRAELRPGHAGADPETWRAEAREPQAAGAVACRAPRGWRGRRLMTLPGLT